jgi:hypothetical protein
MRLAYLTFVCLSGLTTGGAFAQDTDRYRFVDAPPEKTGSHYEKARELYRQGPGKAKEILGELALELAENPESTQALSLQAYTQIGTGAYDDAMTTLDRHDEVTARQKRISPTAILLRGRCLYFMGRHRDAKIKLERFWAFFQGDPEQKAKYDELLGWINAELELKQESK